MKYVVLLFFFITTSCFAVRNPFLFYQKYAAAPQIVGRGIIHDKQMRCEVYTAEDGSIKMRWMETTLGKKSPST